MFCKNALRIGSFRHIFHTRSSSTIAAYPLTALSQSIRYLNINRSVQTRWEKESREASQQRTDYDFDKERWMKRMRIETLDCIVNPDISPLRYTSLSGIKRGIQQYVTMRKLKDRRPDFSEEKLKQQFITLKQLSHARSLDHVKALQLLTIHSEVDRITKEIRSSMNDDFTKKSWKALRKHSDASARLFYAIEVLSFDLRSCYMGQMSKEDWLQLTYRCEFRERVQEPNATPPHRSPNDMTLEADDEWSKIVEFPVFEVRLTDGMEKQSTHHPFKVVGIMKADGTRYGKDGQDAVALRKQFDKSKKWF